LVRCSLRILVAVVLCLLPWVAAQAKPLAVDYRCDLPPDTVSVSSLAQDGWTAAASGRVPGKRNGGTTC
jgi:hypothetical protein